ncbi:MAG: Mov34/MPN/PAD-1 family protein [Caldimicrobium sp.]
MKLLITAKAWKEMISHLEKAYPEEGCGLLLGIEEGTYNVKKVYPMKNIWTNPEERKNRYALSPEDWLKVEKEASKEGLSIIGIFHSHPNYPAEPSPFDIERAWGGYIYLIVEISQGKANKVGAYVFNSYKEFTSLDIEIIKEEAL